MHLCLAFGEEHDLGVPYMSAVLNFLGVLDQERILLDGDDPELSPNEEYISTRRKLLELARRF